MAPVVASQGTHLPPVQFYDPKAPLPPKFGGIPRDLVRRGTNYLVFPLDRPSFILPGKILSDPLYDFVLIDENSHQDLRYIAEFTLGRQPSWNGIVHMVDSDTSRGMLLQFVGNYPHIARLVRRALKSIGEPQYE